MFQSLIVGRNLPDRRKRAHIVRPGRGRWGWRMVPGRRSGHPRAAALRYNRAPRSIPSRFTVMTLDQHWFSEPHPGSGSAISYRIKGKLHAEQTPYQAIEIYETTDWGNLMVI